MSLMFRNRKLKDEKVPFASARLHRKIIFASIFCQGLNFHQGNFAVFCFITRAGRRNYPPISSQLLLAFALHHCHRMLVNTTTREFGALNTFSSSAARIKRRNCDKILLRLFDWWLLGSHFLSALAFYDKHKQH